MDSEIYNKYEIIDAHAHIFPEKIAENATVNIGISTICLWKVAA